MSTSKGVLLLSGGIDSPVAGKLALEQGSELVALHFSGEPFFGKEAVEKTRKLVAILGLPGVWVVQAGEAFSRLVKDAPHPYYFVLSKRLMFRVGQALAKQEEASFLLTGESLGQVSSQTLHNLTAIDAAVTLPVARPLLGWNKEETMHYAKAHGTLELSEGPETCDVLGPKHPATKLTLKAVDDVEKGLPVQGMADAVMNSAVFEEAL